MKTKLKLEALRKEEQIKSLIRIALERYDADDLLEMLSDECDDKNKEYLSRKCSEIATIGGDMMVTSTTLETERILKEFCKQNDIKLKTYFEV